MLTRTIRSLRFAILLLHVRRGRKRENRRYLRAWANFRVLAIDHHQAGCRFSKWKDVAKAIDDPPAEPVYKKILALPLMPDVT